MYFESLIEICIFVLLYVQKKLLDNLMENHNCWASSGEAQANHHVAILSRKITFLPFKIVHFLDPTEVNSRSIFFGGS